MSIKLKSLSEVLKFLMVQNKQYLLAQKGKPPMGKCLDCKRDISAMEMCATCPKCDNQFVCYKCVDKHDHLHVTDFSGMLEGFNPTTISARDVN